MSDLGPDPLQPQPDLEHLVSFEMDRFNDWEKTQIDGSATPAMDRPEFLEQQLEHTLLELTRARLANQEKPEIPNLDDVILSLIEFADAKYQYDQAKLQNLLSEEASIIAESELSHKKFSAAFKAALLFNANIAKRVAELDKLSIINKVQKSILSGLVAIGLIGIVGDNIYDLNSGEVATMNITSFGLCASSIIIYFKSKQKYGVSDILTAEQEAIISLMGQNECNDEFNRIFTVWNEDKVQP